MTPAEFRAAAAVIGWSERQIAARSGYAVSIASQWASGRCAVPDDLARWLERMAQAVRAVGAMPGRS